MAKTNNWDPYANMNNISMAGMSPGAIQQISQQQLRDMHMGINNQYVLPTKQEQIRQLQESIKSQTLQLERLTLDEPMIGPTQRQLNTHESLRTAWSEYQVIATLVLGDKK